MNYDETVEALHAISGRQVAIDSTITRPAPKVKPEHLRNSFGGTIQLEELECPAGDRPADDAAWWSRRDGKAVIRLSPEGGYLFDRQRFRGAHRDDDTLVSQMESITLRVVPLVRTDGEPIEIGSAF